MALEDLTKYESAAVAAVNAKTESGLALTAMQDFYYSRLGEDKLDVIERALSEASEGVRAGTGISNAGVINDMRIYSGKYEEVFSEKTKISDLLTYLTNGFNIPKEAKSGIEAYGDSTYKELKERAEAKDVSEEDKKAISKALLGIETLKSRRLRNATLDIVNKNALNLLNELYPAEEPKKEEED